MIATLLLAAGKSSRMQGRDKLLELVDGEPLLRLLALRALPLGPVYATLPPIGHPRYDILPDPVQTVPVDGELSDNIRAGIATLPSDTQGVILLPADMPEITQADLAKIKDTALKTDALIVRALTEDGRAGHPIYFSVKVFDRFAELRGDRGAFRIIDDLKDEVVAVPLAGNRARLDLDTPQDWADWRAKRP